MVICLICFIFFFLRYDQLKSFLQFVFCDICNRFNKLYIRVTRRGFEITQEHMPLGIVILKEEDENVLFYRLFKLLLAGNSVIVIHNENFYNFSSYCDIFATCGIPPGVINVLSNDDIESLESYLCKIDYSSYAKNVYSLSSIYSGFGIQLKTTVLPLK